MMFLWRCCGGVWFLAVPFVGITRLEVSAAAYGAVAAVLLAVSALLAAARWCVRALFPGTFAERRRKDHGADQAAVEGSSSSRGPLSRDQVILAVVAAGLGYGLGPTASGCLGGWQLARAQCAELHTRVRRELAITMASLPGLVKDSDRLNGFALWGGARVSLGAANVDHWTVGPRALESYLAGRRVRGGMLSRWQEGKPANTCKKTVARGCRAVRLLGTTISERERVPITP